MISKHHGRHYTAQTLRDLSQVGRDGASMLGISEAAEAIGFKTVGVKVDLGKLASDAPLPCILHWSQNHFVVLYKITKSQNLGSSVLRRLRGGRRPIQVKATLNEDVIDFDRYHEDLISDPVSENCVFYIADPAKGLVEYSSEEFGKYWLATSYNGRMEGFALLLSPTSRFFEADGEDGGKIQFTQLFGYLWQYKKLVIQLALGLLLGSAFSLALPFLTQSVVDIGIGTQNVEFIYLILVAQFALFLSSASVEFIRSWILLHISTRLNLSILSDFLAKLMRLPMSFFDVKRFGDIMQRIGDHRRIESFLTVQTLSVTFAVLNLIIFGFTLAIYNLSIFLVAFIFSLAYAFWVILFLRKRRKLDSKRFQYSSKNQGQIVQLIQGMQDIKISGAETFKRWEWERTQAGLFKWSVKNLSLSQIQQTGAVLINNVKNIFITFLAAKAVIDGQLSLGGMVSIQYILAQFNAPIEQMASFLQSWQDAQMSLERLNEVHTLEDEEPYGGKTQTNWAEHSDIYLENLTYTYPGAGNAPILRGISLNIPCGKTTAVVGVSGSGKTTLLKLLLRFYEPEKGGIYLNSTTTYTKPVNEDKLHSSVQSAFTTKIPISLVSHRAWRQKCGVVMQESFVFSDTIARNIAIGEEVIDQDKLFSAAQTANIHNFIKSLPLGYHTLIGAEGTGLSQGQKQRILIARAVYKDPRILLFDEATNALDANNESLIMTNLESFFKGRTVIVVAHRLSTVKKAHQIVVMGDGEILEIGSHRELLNLKGKYFELVSNQLELAED